MKSLILSMAFISTSFFGGENSDHDVTIDNTDSFYDEALYCSASGTTANGDEVELTCWFCNCQENIRALSEIINE